MGRSHCENLVVVNLGGNALILKPNFVLVASREGPPLPELVPSGQDKEDGPRLPFQVRTLGVTSRTPKT